MRRSLGVAGASVAIALLSACTAHPLQPLEQASNVVVSYGALDAHFCTDAPSPAKQKLKYLFVLDHSASNQPGFSNPGDVSATDVQGSHRYGQLVNFVKTLNPDPNSATSFAAIDFSDDAVQPDGMDGFTSDANDFVTKITKDWIGSGTTNAPAPIDSGFTNYQGALHLAEQLIRADAQLEAALLETPPIRSSYVIVFVSDGVPTVATAGNSSALYTQTFTDDIQPEIADILALKNDQTLGPLIGNIALNTAYYSNDVQVPAAQQLLGQMAQAANGQFLQFNSGANILYQQFAPPARAIRNQLADVFLQNENAVWWNGNFLSDSDGDGLPDVVELQQNSNYLQADSDGNGVNDLVEYRTKGRACNDASCSAAGRDAYAICSGFIASTGADGRVTMRSSTNDGLNDCEKYVLGASRTSFNTNGTLIPDNFALSAGLAIVVGSFDQAFADPFADGLINYAKLKLGLPVGVSNRSIGNDFDSRTILLTPEASSDPQVDCYHYQVDHVAMSSDANTLKVMVVQNSAAVQAKPFLKMARAVVSIDHNVARLNPGDFK